MKKDINFKMFLFYHFNPPYWIENDFISPVQVAAIDSDFPVRDDGGPDSIRNLNKYMAEYTGMYYVWKNFSGKLDYIGFGHYGKVILPQRDGPGLPLSAPDFCAQYGDLGFRQDALNDVCGRYDVILPTPNVVNTNGLCYYASNYIRKRFGFRTDEEISKRLNGLSRRQLLTLRQHYAAMHFEDDFEKLLMAIEEIHGLSQRHACERVADGVGEFNGNLVMMRWDIFDKFMTWSYPLMQYLTRVIDVYEPRYANESYQIRVFGFLSERMLNMFIFSNDFKISANHATALVVYPKYEVGRPEKISVSVEYLRSLEKFDPIASGFFKDFLSRYFPNFISPMRFLYRNLNLSRFL